jgi:cell division septum initiation protein DivIVA
MSTADLELFGPPDAESVSPRFTTVLRGYDPDQVHEYIMALVGRTESLENELEEAREQRDSARRRYQMARDDAYNQLGARMADFIRLADQQADRIRREAENEAKQQVSEARDLAQQMRREAEEETERLRLQAEEVLQHAMSERDRLLGGLSQSRELALAELSTARDHLSGIVAQLEAAMEVARSAHIGDPAAEGGAEGAEEPPLEDPRAEDLLERTEGFDIIMPEFLLREEGGDQEG